MPGVQSGSSPDCTPGCGLLEADLVVCVLGDGTPLMALKVKVKAKAGTTYQSYSCSVCFLPASELFNLAMIFERLDFNGTSLVLCHPYHHPGIQG